MKPQVVHESEAHREHVRLEVPIRVEIDGARYRVDDWSIGGFGVEDVAAPYRPGERFRVRVVFPFEGFELAVRVDAEMIYADPDRLRFGCRFAALTGEQQKLFRYVVDSYLAGKLAGADDLLRIHGGPDAPDAAPDAVPGAATEPGDIPAWMTPGRRGPAAAGGAERRARPAARTRAGAGRRYALAALAGLLLAGLVASGVHERLLGVAAVNAVVDAPVYRLRAPIAGLFTSATEPGEAVTQGQAIGLVRGPDGAVAPVESPCPCIVLDQPGVQSQFYQPGEPLVVLIGDDQPPRVRAQVELDDAEELAVGDRARIRLPEGEMLGGRIEQIDVRPERVGLRPAETVAPATPGLVQVWIRPDRPLELDDLGTLASVRFPALPEIGADLLQ